jgi:hypothetical protein
MQRAAVDRGLSDGEYSADESVIGVVGVYRAHESAIGSEEECRGTALSRKVYADETARELSECICTSAVGRKEKGSVESESVKSDRETSVEKRQKSEVVSKYPPLTHKAL